MVAVEWADGCDNVGLVASVDILSLSLSLSFSSLGIKPPSVSYFGGAHGLMW